MYEIEIPESIKVGGCDYTIYIDTPTDRELELDSHIGQHSDLLKRIRIRSSLLPQQFSEVFFHEVLHAVSCVYCADLEERQVVGMSNGIHQVLEQLGVRFVMKDRVIG